MKKQQNENQLDFLDFMPTTHDPAFELEVYAGTGKRVAPDDHPILMAWRGVKIIQRVNVPECGK